jgi:hypothetical protein
MYAVEYRRFYLNDLESILVWPNSLWLLRLLIPSACLVAIGAAFWYGVNSTSGAIFGGVGLAWVALELALGPTAKAQIRTTGAIVDLPLVKRTRRAHKVLAKIDAAVRAARGGVIEPTTSPALSPQAELSPIQTTSEIAAAASIEDLK